MGKFVKGGFQTRQDVYSISSKSFLQLIKDFFKNLFSFFKKSCQVSGQLFSGRKRVENLDAQFAFHKRACFSNDTLNTFWLKAKHFMNFPFLLPTLK